MKTGMEYNENEGLLLGTKKEKMLDEKTSVTTHLQSIPHYKRLFMMGTQSITHTLQHTTSSHFGPHQFLDGCYLVHEPHVVANKTFAP